MGDVTITAGARWAIGQLDALVASRATPGARGCAGGASDCLHAGQSIAHIVAGGTYFRALDPDVWEAVKAILEAALCRDAVADMLTASPETREDAERLRALLCDEPEYDQHDNLAGASAAVIERLRSTSRARTPDATLERHAALLQARSDELYAALGLTQAATWEDMINDVRGLLADTAGTTWQRLRDAMGDEGDNGRPLGSATVMIERLRDERAKAEQRRLELAEKLGLTPAIGGWDLIADEAALRGLLSPPVLRFALAMQERLNASSSADWWVAVPWRGCIDGAKNSWAELETAFHRLPPRPAKQIRRTACELAIYAMALAQNEGDLDAFDAAVEIAAAKK